MCLSWTTLTSSMILPCISSLVLLTSVRSATSSGWAWPGTTSASNSVKTSTCLSVISMSLLSLLTCPSVSRPRETKLPWLAGLVGCFTFWLLELELTDLWLLVGLGYIQTRSSSSQLFLPSTSPASTVQEVDPRHSELETESLSSWGPCRPRPPPSGLGRGRRRGPRTGWGTRLWSVYLGRGLGGGQWLEISGNPRTLCHRRVLERISD